MRKLVLTFISAVAFMLAVAALPTSAFAQGVCGGGNTIPALVLGWEAHGVADDAIATTGSHVGLDGSAMQLAQQGFVWVVVTRGTWVHNTTCMGGHFVPIPQMKWVPAGTRILAPKRLAPAPGKNGTVGKSFDADCGNEHLGPIPVHRPGPKPKHRKKHPAKPCGCKKPPPPAGDCNASNGSAVQCGDCNNMGSGTVVCGSCNNQSTCGPVPCTSSCPLPTCANTPSMCPPPPPPPCTPQSMVNQAGQCMPPCPPQEQQFTGTPGSGFGWVDAGNGSFWQVWVNASGNAFWGASNQIPQGAVTGNAACLKPATGTGSPPPSP